VFVVVASPHGAGTAPNRIRPPTTSSVAEPPGVIDALTEAVPASYTQDSARASAGSASVSTANRPLSASTRRREGLM
jgi:hypothetical protein